MSGDLGVMVPEQASVMIGDERVDVPEMKVKQLTQVLKLVGPFIMTGEAKPFNIVRVVLEHPDEVVQLVALLVNRDQSWVEELSVDNLVLLTTKVVEVNIDFFTQRLLPSVSRGMEQLTAVVKTAKAQPGLIPSKS